MITASFSKIEDATPLLELRASDMDDKKYLRHLVDAISSANMAVVPSDKSLIMGCVRDKEGVEWISIPVSLGSRSMQSSGRLTTGAKAKRRQR